MDEAVTVLIRLHSLGDVVLAQPAATALSENNRVFFVTSTSYAPVVDRMPGNIEVIPFITDAGPFKLRKILHRISPGRIIDLQNNLTTAIATAGMRVSGRFRMNRKLRNDVLLGKAESMPVRISDFLKAAGLNGDVDTILNKGNRSPSDKLRVGIVTGGRWNLKSIPDTVVSEISRLLIDLYNASVILMGGEEDHIRVHEAAESVARTDVAVYAGEGGIAELIERIETLDLLISPDSGPAHLAKALGVPVLVVFTSTSPVLGFWRKGFKGNFMVSNVPCRPCHRHGGKVCPTGEEICRKGIVPRQLTEHAMELLAK